MSSFNEKLSNWYILAKQSKELKEAELALRLEIFTENFKNPKEGTNTKDLDDGWKLKAKHVINRNVDVAELSSVLDNFREHNINPDLVFKWKPEINKKEYNKLTAEQKMLVDEILIFKAGTPQLEIVLPVVKDE